MSFILTNISIGWGFFCNSYYANYLDEYKEQINNEKRDLICAGIVLYSLPFSTLIVGLLFLWADY